MNEQKFCGILLRMLRLERNWSQEDLCSGICAVSYLSKIEQGKVAANQNLMKELFKKLDISWQSVPSEEGRRLCDALYELIFADDAEGIEQSKEYGLLRQEGFGLGILYLDYLVLRAYCCKDNSLIHEDLIDLLDARQKCLYLLLNQQPEKAMGIYPCALAVMQAGILAYQNKKYGLSLQYLQQANDIAANEGYVRIMMLCRANMANCYAKLSDYQNMATQSVYAKRLAAAIGEDRWAKTIDYNLACSAVELGNYEKGYDYFSNLENLSVLDAHKYAICCENLDRRVEALAVLKNPMAQASGLERKMCEIVWFRLKNKDYLQHSAYGELLMSTFYEMQKTLPESYARFHLPWVEEWCAANRQYKTIYELYRALK